MKMKIKRNYAGYYTITVNDDIFRVAKINRGHWEILLNSEYFDTACSYGEAKALIANAIKKAQ